MKRTGAGNQNRRNCLEGTESAGQKALNPTNMRSQHPAPHVKNPLQLRAVNFARNYHIM